MKPVPEAKLRKSAFTLIEILLALVITAVGIVGVMALFPVGLSTNKNTVATRSASDAADQFLHTLAAEIMADWSTVDALPNAMPVMEEDNIVWSNATILPNSNATINFSAVNSADDFDPSTHQDGVFKVTQITPANIIDFRGIIRAWKSIEVVESLPQAGTDTDNLNGDIIPFGLEGDADDPDPNFGYEVGQTYAIHVTPHTQYSPGNFGPLALGGRGGSTYQGNIENGFPELSVGDEVDSEPGNIVGPTVSGVTNRLANNTPYVRVPVVTPFTNGRNAVTVLGFLAFELHECTGSGNTSAQVDATFLGAATTDGDGEGTDGADGTTPSYKLTLKCEVSWPENLEYEHRHKEVFSLKLFKGGNVAYVSEGSTSGGAGVAEDDNAEDTVEEEEEVVDDPPTDDGDEVVDEEPETEEPVAQNNAPVADAISTQCRKNGRSVTIRLSGSDADGDPLTFSVGNPNRGSLSGTPPNLTYTSANGRADASFTYTVNDGQTDSAPATVSIDITN